jgi:hypothetical protein
MAADVAATLVRDRRRPLGIGAERMNPMAPDDPRHGTYAGTMAHKRRNEPLCGPCRKAAAVYQRAYRKRPGKSAAERRRLKASGRAVWRLVDLHREEYERLYAEELGPPLRGSA